MIVALISAYREDPRELGYAIESALQAARYVCIAAEDSDYPQIAPTLASRISWFQGHWEAERDKRNALLHSAKAKHPRASWFLSIDPDEELGYGRRLELLLEQFDPKLPAYPLPRLEPDGKIILCPTKLIRASVQRYTYLDIGISYQDDVWDLDTIELPELWGIIPGWPVLVHYASARSYNPDIDLFYTDSSDGLAGARRYFDLEPFASGDVPPRIGICK